MVLPQYTRRSNKHNSVWSVIGNTPTRKHLFANKCAWMPGSKSTGATKEHEKRKKGLEAAVAAVDLDTGSEKVVDDDLWSSMLTGLEAGDTGPTRMITRMRRKKDGDK